MSAPAPSTFATSSPSRARSADRMLGAISGASLAMREPDSGRRNGRRGLFHVRPDSAGAHLDKSRWRAALGVNGWEDSVRAGLLGPVRAEWPRSGCIASGDRKGVVSGQRVSVRVGTGGGSLI